MKLVGEVGSGKTMICRSLERFLPESVHTAYLSNPSIAAQDILLSIALQLQLPISETPVGPQIMQAMETELIRRFSQGQRVVVFLEDAQALPIPTLEEIRLLSNLECGSAKLIQIILLGQPELDEHLQGHSIRQLSERISHSFFLRPLTFEETGTYLKFRMKTCGYSGKQAFGAEAVHLIHQSAKGSIRRINILADKALLSAFSQNKRTVDVHHVNAALKESAFYVSNHGERYQTSDYLQPCTSQGAGDAGHRSVMRTSVDELTDDVQGCTNIAEAKDGNSTPSPIYPKKQRGWQKATAVKMAVILLVGIMYILFPEPLFHFFINKPQPTIGTINNVKKRDRFIAFISQKGQRQTTTNDLNECVGCDLAQADLHKADLSGFNLSWANLRGANLTGANLTRALLEKANLEEANLSGADLTLATLSRINGINANFSGTVMEEVNLISSRLNGADLSRANLQKAIFKNTVMTNASLKGADLSGAYLTGVDLTSVNTEQAHLGKAIGITSMKISKTTHSPKMPPMKNKKGERYE